MSRNKSRGFSARPRKASSRTEHTKPLGPSVHPHPHPCQSNRPVTHATRGLHHGHKPELTIRPSAPPPLPSYPAQSAINYYQTPLLELDQTHQGLQLPRPRHHPVLQAQQRHDTFAPTIQPHTERFDSKVVIPGHGEPSIAYSYSYPILHPYNSLQTAPHQYSTLQPYPIDRDQYDSLRTGPYQYSTLPPISTLLRTAPMGESEIKLAWMNSHSI